MNRSRCVPLVILTSAMLGLSCDRPDPATPAAAASGSAAAAAPALLTCAPAQASTVSGQIGLLGGILSGDGVKVTIPLGAVLSPTQFTVTVPASQYAEVEITANGQDHFQFLRSVIVAIDYSDCAVDPAQPLSRSVQRRAIGLGATQT